MKNNKKKELITLGISLNTLNTLKESEINTLHRNLIENKRKTNEQVTSTSKNITVTKIPANIAKSTGANISNVDIKQDASCNIIATQLNQGKSKASKEKVLSDTEMKESDEKSEKYNPWAICHAQVGPKRTPKFERCVKAVKKSMAEGKNPFAVILENKIVSLLEKHIQPKMKKAELLDLISKQKMDKPIGKISTIGVMEDDTKTAPTKPKTKPDTKPSTKPFDPFKPKPGVNPKPKAKKSETNEADSPTIAPTKPTTKPGTKNPPKPAPFDPFKPKPGVNPKPKAKNKMPEWLKFNNLGLNLK